MSDLTLKPFEISVSISPDYLTASVSVKLNDPLAVVKAADIEAALLKKNVSYGVDRLAIEKICANPAGIDDVVVAKGTSYKNGEDGKIIYMFNTEKHAKPAILPDGSVDFKNMNFLIPTSKGDTLARRTMPTMGTQGTLVTGKIVKGRDGKIVNFKLGKNVSLSADGLKVVADEDGSIVLDGGTISVQKSLEINGDVGPATGNVDFYGKVNVSGNVLSGYSVKATDDIVINGLVEGADIETGGNLIINLGVQGSDNADLKVGGDLTAKFLSSCNVECKGNILADAVTHCNVSCDGKIKISGKRGILVGGEVYAAKGVEAKQVGSDIGTKTGVHVGVKQDYLKQLQDLQEEKTELSNSLKKIDQVLSLLRAQNASNPAALDRDVLTKSLESREEYGKLLSECELKLTRLNGLLDSLKLSAVCAGDIFPGVRLKIGPTFFSVKDRILSTKFVRENGEVVLKSWSEE